MKNNTQGMAPAPVDLAYAVPDLDTMISPRAGCGPELSGEEKHIAFTRRQDGDGRLRPRVLLDQDKFAALVVTNRLIQEKHGLHRKIHRSIQILMQCVIVTFAVSEDQHRWLVLPLLPAPVEQCIMGVGKPGFELKARHPAVRDGHKVRIELRTKPLNKIREGIAKILVFSASEAMAFHRYGLSEAGVPFVEAAEFPGLGTAQQTPDMRMPLLIQ